jgi:hypothetical protein
VPNTRLRVNVDPEHGPNLSNQQLCTAQDQSRCGHAALEPLSNELLHVHEGRSWHNDVQAGSSGFDAAGGRGGQLESDKSQTNSRSKWEEGVCHGAQNQALTSEDAAEEDALRYDGPLVDNWSSDEGDSGPLTSPRSQVCESSADTYCNTVRRG